MEFNSVVQDVIASTNWKSKSRIVGEAGEIYIKDHLQCQRCNIQDFDKCKTNEPSKDLVCNNCGGFGHSLNLRGITTRSF